MTGEEAVIVIGAGGHARVLVDALLERGVRVSGLSDPNPGLKGQAVFGVPVLGDDGILDSYSPESTLLVNGIGSTESMAARRVVYERLKSRGYRFLSVLHPSAVVSRHAILGEGVQVMAGVVVQAGAKVGDNTILNTRASVDHDCGVGRHCHIAPGATLSGSVDIGDGTHIGVGACITQGVRIGAGCLVAAGAAVVSSVGDGLRVGGVPARVMRAA